MTIDAYSLINRRNYFHIKNIFLDNRRLKNRSNDRYFMDYYDFFHLTHFRDDDLVFTEKHLIKNHSTDFRKLKRELTEKYPKAMAYLNDPIAQAESKRLWMESRKTCKPAKETRKRKEQISTNKSVIPKADFWDRYDFEDDKKATAMNHLYYSSKTVVISKEKLLGYIKWKMERI